MEMNASQLSGVILRCAAGMKRVAPEMNELDGRLGDGDLGATLEKCAGLIETGLGKPFETVDQVFKACAMACMRASGSSFGTLLGVAFQTAAKTCANKAALEGTAMPLLFEAVLAALIERGGAKLGDKTMLDSLEAVRRALAQETDPAKLYPSALAAAGAVLEEFRQKPNRIGRARIFAERSVGMDDPGMVAVLRMIQCVRPTG